MESIFENLENLNVSEESFNGIMSITSNLLEEWEITLDDLIKYDKEHPPKSYEDTMKEWNKEYKKNTTKNQRGEFNTKKRQFPKSYKELGNAYGEPDKTEVEAERAERRSTARHKKKIGIIECFENLNISKECFECIVKSIEKHINEAEGIVPLNRRYRVRKLNRWADGQNDEATEAENKFNLARRNLRNAIRIAKRDT